jgi:CRP-like cAMP-binding protein
MRKATLGQSYADGEAIVRQGEVGSSMYVVQAGEVEVIREAEDGEHRLAVLGAGDFFGEMSIFEREVRSATVRALGSAQVLTVDKRTLLRRIKEDPFLAINILKGMSKRIRELNRELVRARSGQAAGADMNGSEGRAR